LSRRSFDRQLPGNHRFRGGWFGCGCFCYGRFSCNCGCSRYRPRTRSATTSAASTAAGRSWSRFNCRGRRGWFRDGLRLRSRRAVRLDDRSLGRSSGRRCRLIIIEPRLQGLGRLGRFLGGAVSGLLAPLQTLAHPFAHIAACSTTTHTGAIRAPWRLRCAEFDIRGPRPGSAQSSTARFTIAARSNP
jgi:hypothetical protein